MVWSLHGSALSSRCCTRQLSPPHCQDRTRKRLRLYAVEEWEIVAIWVVITHLWIAHDMMLEMASPHSTVKDRLGQPAAARWRSRAMPFCFFLCIVCKVCESTSLIKSKWTAEEVVMVAYDSWVDSSMLTCHSEVRVHWHIFIWYKCKLDAVAKKGLDI